MTPEDQARAAKQDQHEALLEAVREAEDALWMTPTEAARVQAQRDAPRRPYIHAEFFNLNPGQGYDL